LHRSGHRQINFERETKWISSKPKQNGAETKPITYNNKQNYRLLTTTNKTIDCLQQKAKLPIAYIDNKQNYWLLAITATTQTSIDYLQGSTRLKKLLNPCCSSNNNKTDYLWEQKTTAAWETCLKRKK
jgi:hypothetical protein